MSIKASPLNARQIVASLRSESPELDVFEAFWELDRLPIDEVRDALAPWVGPDPDRNRLDVATCLARGIPARPLRLRMLSATRNADVLGLGSVAKEQLRLAGMSWDGADRTPEERLDGALEGSFAGTVERRVLGDVDAPEEPPLFDVLLFAEDAGVVFAAATTKIVALIAYRRVELRDARARVALEQAIAPTTDVAAVGLPSSAIVEEPATRPEATTPIALPPEKKAKKAAVKRAGAKSVVEKTAARKTAPKNRSAKRSAAKKGSAKKSATKKAAAPKKSATKKGSAKKSATKKAAPKKFATKKASPKKISAKKSAPKTSAARKGSAKKSTAKKSPPKRPRTTNPAGKKNVKAPSKKTKSARKSAAKSSR
jgi:hypothetical protein